MGEPRIILIDLNEQRYWADCHMCDQFRRLDHAVAWWCGPVHMEIGHQFTAMDGSEQTVGGMCVCKACHDQHYPEEANG